MKNIAFLSVFSLFLVACGVTQKSFDPPPLVTKELKEDYLIEDLDTSTIFQNTAPIMAWWQAFNDPILDSLIMKARNHNLDINIAIANFFAARAFLKESKLDRLPTITANGSYTRQRLGENVFVEGINPTFNQFNSSLDAFWEVDIMGRVSNRIRGAYASQQAALADIQGVYTSIFAEVAANYMRLRGIQYQLLIANRNVENQQETYNLVKDQFDSGIGNNLNVSRAAAQLANTQATIVPLKAQLVALENSLSVLIGEVPRSLTEAYLKEQPLPNLPQTVLVGTATNLLRRRPDVVKAEQELAQQIARYNLSVAELYPSIQMGGSIGFSAINFSNFGQGESFNWSLFPSIHWAAFNLGRVRRQIDREDALTLAALNHYEKIVLEALEEIKTAMSNYEHELKHREVLRRSAANSAEAATLAQQRYNSGLDDFLDYLNADQTLLQSENALAMSEISSAVFLVAVYKALGGGWEMISEEEIDQKFNTMKSLNASKE